MPGETPPNSSPGHEAAQGQRLTKLTVNITEKSSQALDHAAGLSGDTKTDTINRALQIYDYLISVAGEGGDVYVRGASDSEIQRVSLLPNETS